MDQLEQYLPQFTLPNWSDLLRALELEIEDHIFFDSDDEAEDGDDGVEVRDELIPDTSAGVEENEARNHNDEEEDDEDEDDDDDEEDEMDQIGRLRGFPEFLNARRPRLPGFLTAERPTLSFDYASWFFARYLAPTGEPSPLIPATEPANLPLIEQVSLRPRMSRSGTMTNGVPVLDLNNATITPKMLNEHMIRNRIKELQSKGYSARELDVEIQRLMTQRYYQRRRKESVVPDRRSETVTDEDREPTYTPEGLFGCDHYRRRCKIECSTCLKWYTCRLCHDAKEDHQLIRPATKRVLCMNCGTDQDAGSKCTKCSTVYARYYCDICKLWDDDPSRSIYHCKDCKICRIGAGLGIDLFHCDRCNICMSIELQNNHKCIEHSTECDCPICGEFMFTSTQPVLFMKCGHSIHQTCYNQHVRTSYKCPTCQRSVINMEAQFRILDAEIECQPLPEPYSGWRSIVSCNDCHAKSNVPFHFLGLKCSTCKSYNTAQLKLVKPEELQIREQAVLEETVNVSDLPSEDDQETDEEEFEEIFSHLLSRVSLRPSHEQH